MAPHNNEMQRTKPTLAREPWSSPLIPVLDGQFEVLMQQVGPALRIRFCEASSAFYGKLGFKEQWKHQFATTDQLARS
jgi:hypothetical protein